jgi:hypothetical protein
MLSRINQTLAALLRPDNYRRGAALQERADVLRLYLLTSARASWPDVQERTLEDVEAQAPTVAKQRAEVIQRAQTQALQLLDAWRVEQPPPLPPHLRQPPASDEESARQAAALEEWEAACTAAQRRAFGFSLRCAPSEAGRGAGDGVHMVGAAPPGSVVALYPGVVLLPSDIHRLPGGAKSLAGNEHLIARFDNTVLDASESLLI